MARRSSPARANKLYENPMHLSPSREPEAVTPQSSRRRTKKNSTRRSRAAEEEREAREFAGGGPPGGGYWSSSPASSTGSPHTDWSSSMQREVSVMQRLSERLEAAAAAEQQLQDERLSRLRAVESLRETEAKLTAAQLRAAEAVEARCRAESAKELISAKFEEHVREAEDNIQMLREELSSCTGELWDAVSAAKARAAASDAMAAEARAEASATKVRTSTEAAQNEAMRAQLDEHEQAARAHEDRQTAMRTQLDELSRQLAAEKEARALEQARARQDLATLQEQCSVLRKRAETAVEEAALQAAELERAEERRLADVESERQAALKRAATAMLAESTSARKSAAALSAEMATTKQLREQLAEAQAQVHQLEEQAAVVRVQLQASQTAAAASVVPTSAAETASHVPARAAAEATHVAVAAEALAASAQLQQTQQDDGLIQAMAATLDPATVQVAMAAREAASVRSAADAGATEHGLVAAGDVAQAAVDRQAADTSPRSFARELKTAIKTAAANGDVKTLSALLQQGCTRGLDLEDGDGRSALWVAASSGHAEAVQLLAESGASLDPVCPNTSFTALHAAVQGEHAAVVSLLLTRGADSARTNKKGKTALHLARRKKGEGAQQIVHMLSSATTGDGVADGVAVDTAATETASTMPGRSAAPAREPEQAETKSVPEIEPEPEPEPEPEVEGEAELEPEPVAPCKPASAEICAVIEKFAGFIGTKPSDEAEKIEHMARVRKREDPRFRFLFGGDGAAYYSHLVKGTQAHQPAPSLAPAAAATPTVTTERDSEREQQIVRDSTDSDEEAELRRQTRANLRAQSKADADAAASDLAALELGTLEMRLATTMEAAAETSADAPPPPDPSPIVAVGRDGLKLLSSHPQTTGSDGSLKPGIVECTFRSPGALGLKLNEDELSGRAVVVRLNLGTQATHHAQLRPGLFLEDIGGKNVAGFSYTEALELLKQSKTRPLTLRFLTELPHPDGRPRAFSAPEGSEGVGASAALIEEMPRVRSAEAALMLTIPDTAADVTEENQDGDAAAQ